jgi:hypothetical protein
VGNGGNSQMFPAWQSALSLGDGRDFFREREQVRERGGRGWSLAVPVGKMNCQRSVEYRAPVRFALTGGKFIASDAASFRTARERMGKLGRFVNSVLPISRNSSERRRNLV